MLVCCEALAATSPPLNFFDFRPAGTPFNPTPGAPPPGLRVVAPIVTNLPDDVSFKKFTPKVTCQ